MKKIITVLGLLCSLPVLAQSVTEPTITDKEQQEFVDLLKSRGIKDAKQGRAIARDTLRKEKLIGQAAWKQQPVPGLRMTEPAMAVMYVWQSSSGRESMTVLQALSIP